MLFVHWKTALTVALCATVGSQSGLAQAPAATILTVDLENFVQYNEDTDFSKFATNPNATTSAAPVSFAAAMGIADIVAVNGQPAKGTVVMSQRSVALVPAPTPGQAIADTQRGGAMTPRTQKITSSLTGACGFCGNQVHIDACRIRLYVYDRCHAPARLRRPSASIVRATYWGRSSNSPMRSNSWHRTALFRRDKPIATWNKLSG